MTQEEGAVIKKALMFARERNNNITNIRLVLSSINRRGVDEETFIFNFEQHVISKEFYDYMATQHSHTNAIDTHRVFQISIKEFKP